MSGSDHRKTKAQLVAELEALRAYSVALAAGDGARESDERYRRLVAFLPDSVRIVCDGMIVHANPAAAQLFGAAAPEELIGRRAEDFVAPADRPRIEARRRMVRALGTVPLIEDRRLRLDGSPVDVASTAIGISWNGRPASLVISRDVTSRVRAHRALMESQQRLAGIVENLPGAAYECVTHANGRISFVYISAGVRDLFGIESEAVLAHTGALVRRIHPDDRPLLARAMRAPGRTLAPVEVELRAPPPHRQAFATQ